MNQQWSQNPLKIHLKIDPEKGAKKGAHPGSRWDLPGTQEDLQVNKITCR